jgi:hypothetical protein
MTNDQAPMTNGVEKSRSQPMARESWRFSLRQLFFWIFVASVVLAIGRLAWFAVDAARMAARRSERRNDVRQLLLALHMFNDTNKHLPPATVTGRDARRKLVWESDSPPLHSWRFIICPFLEASPWSYDYSKPWNHPMYGTWNSLSLRLYCHDRNNPLHTNFVAVTGPDTAWGDGSAPPLSVEEVPNDLILIVETRKSGLHWMQPGDFDLGKLPRTINAPDGSGISSNDPVGVWIGLADASVRFVPTNTPFEELEPFFTITGAAANDIDDLLPLASP